MCMSTMQNSQKQPKTGIIKECVLKKAVCLFNTYEEYLDSMIIKDDLFYLEDLGFARKLVELGIINHSNSAIIPRKVFNTRKQTQHAHRNRKASVVETFTLTESQYTDLHDPLLAALWEREESNKKKIILTIIFLRVRMPAGYEISGYIDFNHRLETENFSQYWNGNVRLQPRRSDLSYVAWRTQGPVYTRSSRNFSVLPATLRSLQIQCRLDGRILKLLPANGGIIREKIPMIGTSGIIQAELMDHVVNRGSA